MTIENEQNVSGPYIANGVTTVFARNFPLRAEADLQVVQIRDGVETTLTTGFTIEDADQPAGNVVFTTAPPTGDTIYLVRDTPLLQETDYNTQGAVTTEQVERDLDTLVMQQQDTAERINRTLKVSRAAPALQDLPAPEAGKLLIANDAANGWENGPDAGDIAGAQANAASATAAAQVAEAAAAEAVSYKSELSRISVTEYDAVADAVSASGDVTTTTLTVSSALFTSGDVGKTVVIPGALSSGPGGDLITTIAAFNSDTSVTLALAADTVLSGVVFYYGTDNTAAFQAAYDALNLITQSQAVFVPPIGDYLIAGSVSVQISATGNGGCLTWSNATFRAEKMGARLLTAVHDGAGSYAPVFNCLKDGTAFVGLNFQHIGTPYPNSSTICLNLQKTDNTDDAEFVCNDCTFRYYYTHIRHYGRSAQIQRNAFVNHVIAVRLNWVSDGTFPGQPNTTDLPLGFRGHFVSENHQHNGDLLCLVDGSDAIWGLKFTNNVSDVYGRLFSGPANYSSFVGNQANGGDHTGALSHIAITGGGVGNVIVGNKLGGYRITGANVATRTAATGLRFDVEAQGGTICGNEMAGFTSQATFFAAGATGLSCVGNSFSDSAIGLHINGTIADSEFRNSYTSNTTDFDIQGVTFSGRTFLETENLQPLNADSEFFDFRNGSGTRLGGITFEDAGLNGITVDSEGPLILKTSNNTVRPFSDNQISLGISARRFSVVYAGTGAINTSDERLKTQIEAIPDEWLDAWLDVEFSRFKFIDSVQAKRGKARWHLGLIAQRVEQVFRAHGINPFAIGLLCLDEWDDGYEDILGQDGKPTGQRRKVLEAGSLYGIRYEEALILDAACNRRELLRLSDRVQALEIT